jgi:hypothetical protein
MIDTYSDPQMYRVARSDVLRTLLDHYLDSFVEDLGRIATLEAVPCIMSDVESKATIMFCTTLLEHSLDGALDIDLTSLDTFIDRVTAMMSALQDSIPNTDPGVTASVIPDSGLDLFIRLEKMRGMASSLLKEEGHGT